MGKHILPKTRLPDSLRGEVDGSFAQFTVKKRLPKILRETLANNIFPPRIKANLEEMLNEIPDKPLKPIPGVNAPDAQDWSSYLSQYEGCNWLQVPWFFVEMYFYRRIIDAIEFYSPGDFQSYDPYLKQKQRVLDSASPSVANLGRLRERSVLKKDAHPRAEFHQLLVLNVWGNQADLSMWSASEDRPDHQDSADQLTHLLVDDADNLYDSIASRSQPLERVDFILDNYGPELMHDIGLADLLLNSHLCRKINFHAKPHPHFVSDAMIKDIHSSINYLTEYPDNAVQNLAHRVKGYLHEGSLTLKDDYFSTSPLPFWEMPDYIWEDLSASDLVISKGDANYRRLAGDRDWPPTTPFEKVVRYFPAPLLALRVLKSELVLGLSPQQVEQLDLQDASWKVNGNWGVIQFFQGQE